MKPVYIIASIPLLLSVILLGVLITFYVESFHGDLNEARMNHTATMLGDGNILVEGGFTILRSSPQVGSPLAQALYNEIFGDGTEEWKTLSSSEVFDRKKGKWETVGPIQVPRGGQCTTLMADGEVLMCGGYSSPTFEEMNSAEVYDPKTRHWHETAPMNIARFGAISLLLKTGKVLVIGGSVESAGRPRIALPSCELYDPATQKWKTTGSLILQRDEASVNPLPDGRIMVVGGTVNGSVTATCEIYDPATEQWTLSKEMRIPRKAAATELLKDGRLLVAGGKGNDLPLACTELYDPLKNEWQESGDMVKACYYSGCYCLPSGEVILVGGCVVDDKGISTCQLYNPRTGTWRLAPSLHTARTGFDLTLLTDGKVFLTAGIDNEKHPLSSCEMYDPVTNKWAAP